MMDLVGHGITLDLVVTPFEYLEHEVDVLPFIVDLDGDDELACSVHAPFVDDELNETFEREVALHVFVFLLLGHGVFKSS